MITSNFIPNRNRHIVATINLTIFCPSHITQQQLHHEGEPPFARPLRRRRLECDMTTRPPSLCGLVLPRCATDETKRKQRTLLTDVLSKFSLSLLVAAALGAVASPVDHIIHRRFSCVQRLDGYCHASNVDSYCSNGQFRSKAQETCQRFCKCVTRLLAPLPEIC